MDAIIWENGVFVGFALIMLTFIMKLFLQQLEQHRIDRDRMLTEHAEDRRAFRDTIKDIVDSISKLENTMKTNTNEIGKTNARLDKIEDTLNNK